MYHSGSKDAIEGVEMKIQLKMEFEMEGFLPFVDVGVMKSEGMLVMKVGKKWTRTQQYIQNHPKNMLLGVMKILYIRLMCCVIQRKICLMNCLC